MQSVSCVIGKDLFHSVDFALLEWRCPCHTEAFKLQEAPFILGFSVHAVSVK